MAYMTDTKRSSLKIMSLSVRSACLAAGVTTGKLAPVLDVGKTTMSLKLNNRVRWTFEDIDTLADLFDVEPEDMLSGRTNWNDVIDARKVRSKLGLDSEPTVSCVEPRVTQQHAIAV